MLLSDLYLLLSYSVIKNVDLVYHVYVCIRKNSETRVAIHYREVFLLEALPVRGFPN